MRIVCLALLIVLFAAWSGATALAQEPQVTGDQDGSSQQTEESDEAYRRRMELEDARRRDPTYTDPADDYRRDLEKIDKLPEESRNNIRDQLVDVIVDNPDWQPGDALKEYPYDPTAAAQADPGLMQQEQEAWDEQIEKYHAREAAAFGAYRGPVQGPGNPDGQEGGEEGQQGQEGQQGGQQGGESGQGGQQGSQGSESSNGSAGTYQPYQSQGSSAEDAVSTEGVSESALDFLMQRQSGQAGGQPGQQQAGQPSGQQTDQQANSQTGAQQAQQGSESSTAQDQPGEESQSPSQQTSQQQDSQQDQSESREDSQEESDQAQEQDMRGIIAIEDLDKLEGAGPGPVPAMPAEREEEEEDPDDP